MTCIGCGAPMAPRRPGTTLPPGARWLAAGGRCTSCYNRHQRDQAPLPWEPDERAAAVRDDLTLNRLARIPTGCTCLTGDCTRAKCTGGDEGAPMDAGEWVIVRGVRRWVS